MPLRLSLEQATRGVEDNFRKAFAQLPAHARAEKIAEGTSPGDEPAEGGPPGGVVASVDYRIHGLSPAEYGHWFDVLSAWWTGNGFVVLADARPRGLYLWVEDGAAGFRMAAQANDAGGLFLTATSPCVWPDSGP
ncbi:hypothetical protein [Streptosporangium sp. NBC_01756]|uniref:hypothetical protein n=1 Tax=Streptosporangium sp. NBC_01756 TaxID=2975950 RepID=UPI002DD86638|nr:hypothetical protein [Streptosporangium sp. NBC_01756]WSC84666.1 hypothetical protein OIE48_30435 [Streptosporangium sp. NBC_01756]